MEWCSTKWWTGHKERGSRNRASESARLEAFPLRWTGNKDRKRRLECRKQTEESSGRRGPGNKNHSVLRAYRSTHFHKHFSSQLCPFWHTLVPIDKWWNGEDDEEGSKRNYISSDSYNSCSSHKRKRMNVCKAGERLVDRKIVCWVFSVGKLTGLCKIPAIQKRNNLKSLA